MLGKEPHRKPSSGRRIAALALASCLAVVVPARAADGLLDSVLEKMNIKAAPAAPGPEFIERTRPDPADLGYLPTALPHKVSPLPVKSADEIQAQKDALDAAKKRQLDPGSPKPIGAAAGTPKPVGLAANKKPAKPKPAAVAD